MFRKNMLFVLLTICGMNFSMHAMKIQHQTDKSAADLIREQHQANIDLSGLNKYFRPGVLLLASAPIGFIIMHLMKGKQLSDNDAFIAFFSTASFGVLSSCLWTLIDNKETERDQNNKELRRQLAEISTVKKGATS